MNSYTANDQPAVIQTPANTAWIYRSFHNNPILVGSDPAKALALIFGEGVFSLSVDQQTVSGLFTMSSDYVLDISGQMIEAAGSVKMTLVGKGRDGTPTAGWEYDYQAFQCPDWPSGVDQIRAFVGTVIRALPHNGEPAGVTASFILVADNAPATV